QGAVQRGTAMQALAIGRPVGGKTGTTNDYRSAWFMGFTPQLVAGVFVGFDDNRSLGNGETGSRAAVPIFVEFLTEPVKGTPPLEFVPLKNAKFAVVRGIREAFRPGTEPTMETTPLIDGMPVTPLPYNALSTPAQPVPTAPPPARRPNDD